MEAVRAARSAIFTSAASVAPAGPVAADAAYPARRLRRGLTAAVCGGHDTDTVAAIAGGLLGASAMPVAAGAARLAELRSRGLIALADAIACPPRLGGQLRHSYSRWPDATHGLATLMTTASGSAASDAERLRQDEWNAGTLTVDSDGEYPFRCGTAAEWVRLLDSDPVMVRVSAHAATGLRPSVKLLAELNSVQCGTLTATGNLHAGVVVVSQTISPVALTRPVLGQALDAVGGIADDIGLLLAGRPSGNGRDHGLSARQLGR